LSCSRAALAQASVGSVWSMHTLLRHTKYISRSLTNLFSN
jgi:hypothetical protein